MGIFDVEQAWDADQEVKQLEKGLFGNTGQTGNKKKKDVETSGNVPTKKGKKKKKDVKRSGNVPTKKTKPSPDGGAISPMNKKRGKRGVKKSRKKKELEQMAKLESIVRGTGENLEINKTAKKKLKVKKLKAMLKLNAAKGIFPNPKKEEDLLRNKYKYMSCEDKDEKKRSKTKGCNKAKVTDLAGEWAQCKLNNNIKLLSQNHITTNDGDELSTRNIKGDSDAVFYKSKKQKRKIASNECKAELIHQQQEPKKKKLKKKKTLLKTVETLQENLPTLVQNQLDKAYTPVSTIHQQQGPKKKKLKKKKTLLKTEETLQENLPTLVPNQLDKAYTPVSTIHQQQGPKKKKLKKKKTLLKTEETPQENLPTVIQNQLDKAYTPVSTIPSDDLYDNLFQPVKANSKLNKGSNKHNQHSTEQSLITFPEISTVSTKKRKKKNSDTKTHKKKNKTENAECTTSTSCTGTVNSQNELFDEPFSKSPPKSPFNIDRLKLALAKKNVDTNEEAVNTEADSPKKKKAKLAEVQPLRERMQAKLSGARFRYINEQLYTCTGSQAQHIMQQDPEAFKVYHEGFESQVEKWPLNPVKSVIKFIKRRPNAVVADLGCGDAKLAQAVNNKVHSFDLVSVNHHVTSCDMAHVPLKSESVDVAVFCLALMGTNLVDFICEANRILKKDGILIVAEVISRFEKVGSFIRKMSKLGFNLTKKDDTNKMFIWFEFSKTSDAPAVQRRPLVELMPCTYKKR